MECLGGMEAFLAVFGIIPFFLGGWVWDFVFLSWTAGLLLHGLESALHGCGSARHGLKSDAGVGLGGFFCGLGEGFPLLSGFPVQKRGFCTVLEAVRGNRPGFIPVLRQDLAVPAQPGCQEQGTDLRLHAPVSSTLSGKTARTGASAAGYRQRRQQD